MNRKMLISAMAIALAASVFGGDKVPLWPEGKMPSVQTNQMYNPTVEFFIPKKKTTDACLIVAPGGAYMGVATGVEGMPVLDYFKAKGMSIAMLNYRTPRPIGLPKHLTAWQDAQRAVRIVRDAAKKYGYSPDKIGFMGFSAGGHLTLMTAVSSKSQAYQPIDALDNIPCNVNWAVPVYPAYALADGANGGNRNGGNDLEKDVLVPELKFDDATPPMCFIHGDADGYSSMASVRAYHKLRTMKRPAELHIFAKEPHVFFRSCAASDPGAYWLDRVWEWLSKMGYGIHPNVNAPGWTEVVNKKGELNGISFKEGAWSHIGNGVLRANKDSAIWTDKDYSNFVLDLEYKLDPGANSGVVIYCSNVNNWIPNSVEIQLLDDYAEKWKKDPAHYMNGGLYGHLASLVPGGNAKPAGMWNRMTVWGNGKKVKVAINNAITVDTDLSQWTSAKKNPNGTDIPSWLSKPWAELPTHGRIGFQGKHGASSVFLRNIRIRSL